MKKNKMMRTAAVLGVAALLTTSALSGTLAKYTTTAEGGDSARVAKWGITMGSNGSSTFSNTYDASQDPTVKGTSNDKVIAPGTHGEASYVVSGAPETAYQITFKGEATKDVYLKSGLKFKYDAENSDNKKDIKYTNPGTKNETEVSTNYYPVNYSVKISSTANNKAQLKSADSNNEQNDYIKTLNAEQTFETLSDAMQALSNTVVTYSEPNTEAGLTVEFKWAWAFNSENETGANAISVNSHKANDTYDTILGDLVNTKNGDLIVTSTDSQETANLYSTNIEYKLTMTATQID